MLGIASQSQKGHPILYRYLLREKCNDLSARLFTSLFTVVQIGFTANKIAPDNRLMEKGSPRYCKVVTLKP